MEADLTSTREPARRLWMVLVALALAVGGLSFSAVSAHDRPCASPTNVPGLGPACPTSSGLWSVTLEDGHTFLTHGPDTVDAKAIDNPDKSRILEVKRRKPSCVGDVSTQFHIQVLYAHPNDQPDRYAEKRAIVARAIERINGMLYAEGAEFGRPMLYRMACSRGDVSVRNVDLNVGSGATFPQVVAALRSAGFVSPIAKYWLYFDDKSPKSAAGIAEWFNDRQASVDNAANFGPTYGLFWARSGIDGRPFPQDRLATTLMHEGAHNLGAVNNAAPNSTGAGHCTDDNDVMCYRDGGPFDSRFRANVCSTMHFDCRHNDYFNPKPKNGSYLARNWNLGSPLNRFFAGCFYKSGELTVGTAGADVDSVTSSVVGSVASRSYKIPKGCRSRPFAVSGIPTPLPSQVDDIRSAEVREAAYIAFRYPSVEAWLAATTPIDVDVCFFKGGKFLRCFSGGETEEGTVPGTATKAVVQYRAGSPAVFTFSIV